LWIDINKANELGGDALKVLERLEAGLPVEVSTAYFRDLEPATGEFGGVPYIAIARNLRPNHLALLPDDVGACSWQDGCGAPRVNQRGDMKTVITNIELSLTDQDMIVYEAWYSSMMTGRIINVYADRVDVTNKDGLWAVPYAIDDNGKVTFSDPKQYQLATNAGFIQSLIAPIVQALKSKEVIPVTKKDELITALVANGRNKLEKATLEKLEEKELQALTDQLAETPDPAPQQQPPPTPEQAVPAQPAPDAPPAWAQAIIEKVDGLEKRFQANTDQEKADLVEELAANQQALPKEALEKLDINQLRQYRQFFIPADFSGRGLPAANRAGGEWEEYKTPEVETPGKNGGTK
jgi:hypothetical protein